MIRSDKPTVDLLLADTSRRARKEAEGRANAAQARRGAHVGATDQIREFLRNRGAATKTEIYDSTGLPWPTVSSLVSQMVSNGGMVAIGKRGSLRYALVDSRAGREALKPTDDFPSGEFAIATAPADRPFVALKRDFFEHWNLAMTARTT